MASRELFHRTFKALLTYLVAVEHAILCPHYDLQCQALQPQDSPALPRHRVKTNDQNVRRT